MDKLDLTYFNAYVQRKLGNESKKYRIYEKIIDERTNRGRILIWNANNLDYTIVTSELNPVNLIQDEVPDLLLNLIEK